MHCIRSRVPDRRRIDSKTEDSTKIQQRQDRQRLQSARHRLSRNRNACESFKTGRHLDVWGRPMRLLDIWTLVVFG
jgi:hypothetical protein